MHILTSTSLGRLAKFTVTLGLMWLPFYCLAGDWAGQSWTSAANPQPPSSNANNAGYLGTYNPWSGNGGNSQEDQPRYRRREHSTTSPNMSRAPDYRGTPMEGVPNYAPYGAGDGVGEWGGSHYGMPAYPLIPALAPWYGGLNPQYGSYWNDPYRDMAINRGALWPYMWNW